MFHVPVFIFHYKVATVHTVARDLPSADACCGGAIEDLRVSSTDLRPSKVSFTRKSAGNEWHKALEQAITCEPIYIRPAHISDGLLIAPVRVTREASENRRRTSIASTMKPHMSSEVLTTHSYSGIDVKSALHKHRCPVEPGPCGKAIEFHVMAEGSLPDISGVTAEIGTRP